MRRAEARPGIIDAALGPADRRPVRESSTSSGTTGLIVGRGEDADVRIDHARVSRRHALIHRNDTDGVDTGPAIRPTAPHSTERPDWRRDSDRELQSR